MLGPWSNSPGAHPFWNFRALLGLKTRIEITLEVPRAALHHSVKPCCLGLAPFVRTWAGGFTPRVSVLLSVKWEGKPLAHWVRTRGQVCRPPHWRPAHDSPLPPWPLFTAKSQSPYTNCGLSSF